MDVHLGAVLAATIAMFAVGAVWYMGLFAKLWGTMHGFDKLSKKEQKEMQSKMGPYYGAQMLVTVLSAIVLSGLISQMPTVSAYKIVFSIWLGFVMPAQVSAVMFGGTETKWMAKKMLIMSAETLIRLLVAAWVITQIQM